MIEVANVAQMKNTNENAALKPNPAHGLRTELARKIVFLAGKEENRITDIPGVSLHRRTSPAPPCRMTYHPGIIVVAQGSKRVCFNIVPTALAKPGLAPIGKFKAHTFPCSMRELNGGKGVP